MARVVGIGIQPERIRKYGFAFRGKEILIGEGRIRENGSVGRGEEY